MDQTLIDRALACRLIDRYMKQHGLVGPLTQEHLARSAWSIIQLLTSPEVRAMYDENAFHKLDVESSDLYELYTMRLVERFVAAWLDKNTAYNGPLTEEHLLDLIGDFQDLVWYGYGDNAIRAD